MPNFEFSGLRFPGLAENPSNRDCMGYKPGKTRITAISLASILLVIAVNCLWLHALVFRVVGVPEEHITLKLVLVLRRRKQLHRIGRRRRPFFGRMVQDLCCRACATVLHSANTSFKDV